jgi:hypothetical protein
MSQYVEVVCIQSKPPLRLQSHSVGQVRLGMAALMTFSQQLQAPHLRQKAAKIIMT